MAKQWTLKADKFLVEYEGMADFVADHDLGFKGKNAGTKRLNLLKETGVYDKIVALSRADEELWIAHTLAFSRSEEALYMATERAADLALKDELDSDNDQPK